MGVIWILIAWAFFVVPLARAKTLNAHFFSKDELSIAYILHLTLDPPTALNLVNKDVVS